MVDGQLFDTLASLAMELRKQPGKPFGGIQVSIHFPRSTVDYVQRTKDRVADRPIKQLVITGDFFQLPPVTPSGKEVCFAFESSAWKTSIERIITLTQVFRQKDDSKCQVRRAVLFFIFFQFIGNSTYKLAATVLMPACIYTAFIALLNDMRKGEISPTATNTLKALARPLSQAEGDLLPTELFPLRAEVDRANASRMAARPGPTVQFASRDTGPAAPPDKRRRLLENNLAVVQTLVLKRDAQVMLVKNVSETLVNGSVGRVVDFCEDPAAKQQKQSSEGGGASEQLFPLVEFSTFKGKETRLVLSEEFRVEDGEGNLLARRVQVSQPLFPPQLSHSTSRTVLQDRILQWSIEHTVLTGNLDPCRLSMGNVHPQSPRPDHPAGQG